MTDRLPETRVLGLEYGFYRKTKIVVFQRKMGNKRRKMNFLHFFPIFIIFDDFSKSSVHSTLKNGKKWRKAMSEKILPAKNWNFQQYWLRKMQFWRFFEWDFFSFFTKNGSKFFVFHEKWKCEKNRNHA